MSDEVGRVLLYQAVQGALLRSMALAVKLDGAPEGMKLCPSRGIVLTLVPAQAAGIAAHMLGAGPAVVIAGVVALLLGLWLAYAGWVARPAGSAQCGLPQAGRMLQRPT